MEEFPRTSSPYYLNQDYDSVRWKSGKRVDPRILSLLEAFGDIYVNRKELFKKIFGGKHEELFSKIATAKKKKKQMKKMKSMPRSLSMHAIGQRGLGGDEIEGMKLERFKVRTPNVIVDDGGQVEDQTNTTIQGPKNGK